MKKTILLVSAVVLVGTFSSCKLCKDCDCTTTTTVTTVTSGVSESIVTTNSGSETACKNADEDLAYLESNPTTVTVVDFGGGDTRTTTEAIDCDCK